MGDNIMTRLFNKAFDFVANLCVSAFNFFTGGFFNLFRPRSAQPAPTTQQRPRRVVRKEQGMRKTWVEKLFRPEPGVQQSNVAGAPSVRPTTAPSAGKTNGLIFSRLFKKDGWDQLFTAQQNAAILSNAPKVLEALEGTAGKPVIITRKNNQWGPSPRTLRFLNGGAKAGKQQSPKPRSRARRAALRGLRT